MDLTSRINDFLTKNHRKFNIVAVLFLQFIVLLIVIGQANEPYERAPDGAVLLGYFALGLVATVPLYFRYRYPYACVYISLSATLIEILFPLNNSLDITPFSAWFTGYHAGRHWNRNMRKVAVIIGIIIPIFIVLKFFIFAPSPLEELSGIEFVMLITVAFLSMWVTHFLLWFIGTTRRMIMLRRNELRERATRLEFEQQQEQRMAAQDERTRIARDIHDIVAHSLSSIITQADGAQYTVAAAQNTAHPRAGDIAEQTLESIADTARDSLTQMRSLLGVLRTNEQTFYAPAPTLSEIPTLVDQARRSGMLLDFSGVEGTPRFPLPQGGELAAYRVVQEGLTNVFKHARDAQTVHLKIAWDRRGLNINLYNSRPLGMYPAAFGSGNGLRTMAERVNMYGGDLYYSPDRHGGYTLNTHLPYRDT